MKFLILLLTFEAGICFAEVANIAEKLGYPANSKLLIILADDVGVYHAANLASFTALNQGGVTTGTVMMTSPWLTEVAAYAKQHSDISLGVHLTLCSEYNTYRWGPVASKDQVPSLLDPFGFLFPHGSDTVSHGEPAEIERELRAQMDRAIQFGFNPDFVDSHQRALFSNQELFEMYMKIAHDYKLPFLIGRDRGTGGKFVPLVHDKDLVVDSVTVIPSTTPSEDWMGFYSRAVKALKPGLHQFYVHLAFDDGEAEAISVDHTAYGAAWRQRDFNVMTSPEFKKVLEENHVILVSWKDLKKIL
jgi:chitin disaccharide deacetylase